jgi:ABC-type antimicrobial peptide transport system permease subunit
LIRPVVNHLLSDAGVDVSSARSIIMNGTLAALFAASTVFAAMLAASVLPARRAASIEPMQALRTE